MTKSVRFVELDSTVEKVDDETTSSYSKTTRCDLKTIKGPKTLRPLTSILTGTTVESWCVRGPGGDRNRW